MELPDTTALRPAPIENPPQNISKSLTTRLYISHFLSTWNSRLFEFGSVLFLASIYPGTLLPMSIYALVRGAAAIFFSPALGSWIDKGNRLTVVRVSIIGQRLAVAVSCAMFWVMERHNLNPRVKRGLFAVTVLMACVEKLCSVMNLVSVERDWVVAITDRNSQERRNLNARMRRIDLFCKVIGPLVVGSIDSASTIIAIWITLGMNVVSVLVEYLCIARVYKLVPELQREPLNVNGQRTYGGIEGNEPSPAEQVTSAQTQSQANQRETTRKNACVRILSSKYFQTFFPTSSIPLWYHHQAWLPSFSLTLLYLTVLSFSGQMTTFLLAVGYTSAHVTIARTVNAVFEISATFTTPRAIKKIGAVRTGIWSLSWQMIFLGAGVGWFFAEWIRTKTFGLVPVSAFVGAVIVSRLGLWGFDLSAQQIIQEEVDMDSRGVFSTVEASAQNFFELLSYISTIIFSRPDQFQWPILISVVATFISGALYTFYLRRKRGHLIHLPKWMMSKERGNVEAGGVQEHNTT